MADMVVAEDEDALGSQSLSHRFVVEADVFSVAVANVDSGPDVSLGPPVGASQGLLRLGVAKVEYEGGPFLDEELVGDVDREVFQRNQVLALDPEHHLGKQAWI